MGSSGSVQRLPLGCEDVSRRAKIVCTLGPATATAEKVRDLVAAGMDVARMNFSHGSHADHKQVYDLPNFRVLMIVPPASNSRDPISGDFILHPPLQGEGGERSEPVGSLLPRTRSLRREPHPAVPSGRRPSPCRGG